MGKRLKESLEPERKSHVLLRKTLDTLPGFEPKASRFHFVTNSGAILSRWLTVTMCHCAAARSQLQP
jgi:hypothetical protein